MIVFSSPQFSRNIRLFLDVKTLIHPLISRGFQGSDRFAPFSYARARASTERALTFSVRWKCPAGIAPYFHSQKRLALSRSLFSYARARASTERAMPSLRPFGGNALRALTPTFTRKSALRSRARFFLMPALVQARSGHKKNARTPNGAGRFCSLVPVVGLEPTRILLHRILSPARLPVSPHRRTK